MLQKIIKALQYLENNGLKSFIIQLIRKCFKINKPEKKSSIDTLNTDSVKTPNLTGINFYKIEYPFGINRINLFIDEIEYNQSNIILLLLSCIVYPRSDTYLRIITKGKVDYNKFYSLFHYITYMLHVTINFIDLSSRELHDLDISTNDYFVTNEFNKILLLRKFNLPNKLIFCKQKDINENNIISDEILKLLINDGLLYYSIDNLLNSNNLLLNNNPNFDTIINQMQLLGINNV